MSDLIKREDAIKAVAEVLSLNRFASFKNIKDFGRFAERMLRNVPSADRPQGEWKPKNHHTDYCSNCGFEETQWRTADYNFCPSCGARIKGVDDEHTI